MNTKIKMYSWRGQICYGAGNNRKAHITRVERGNWQVWRGHIGGSGCAIVDTQTNERAARRMAREWASGDMAGAKPVGHIKQAGVTAQMWSLGDKFLVSLHKKGYCVREEFSITQDDAFELAWSWV